ncbi:formin-like protein 13 isoform X1 [Tanacetum coccineum]
MTLLRRLYYKKPPDGLLEISERVYVFDCCFTTDAWDQDNYKGYIGDIVSQLRDHYSDASILVFNFREGDATSQLASALSKYDMTIVEYPRHYEGCPLLSMEVIHHFLRSCESWLSLGMQNVLLMHCERGGWPVLAFMLAALLIYRKYYSGESKTLDMVYKQAPSELLHLFSSVNPLPSQLRYLQYVSRRNVATEWPPLERALSLDCVIMRMTPDVDGNGGCCPIFRIYGQDPYMPGDKTTKLLFSTPKRIKNAECELVIIDVDCHIQGDIVLECINLHDDWEHENIIFRAMFNTSFIRSNILILNRDEIDILWDAKDQFPKDFKAEFLFSEMDAAASITPVDSYFFEDKEELPIEAFATVQEMFSSVDWLIPKNDVAFDMLRDIATADYDHIPTPTSITPLHPTDDPVHPFLRGKESHLQESISPSYPSRNLSIGLEQSPLSKFDQTLQEKLDIEGKTLPPEPSAPPQSAFPPSILPPSSPLKEIDTKVGPSTSSREDQSSTTRTPRGPHASAPRPWSPPRPIQPRSPPPSTPIKEKTSPLPPLSPPPTTVHTKEKSDKTIGSYTPPPPPPPLPPPPIFTPINDTPSTTMPRAPAPPIPPPPAPQPSSVPPPPPPPAPSSPHIPSTPPPPPPPIPSNQNQNGGVVPPPPPPGNKGGGLPGAPAPPPPFGKGRGLPTGMKDKNAKKLKPLHWLKLTRAVQGSLWAETQKSGEAVKTPEIDFSELENLFSAQAPNSDKGANRSKSASKANKPEKVQLIDHRRAYNCEIMLSKVKIPLNELMDFVLALDESALDADQVENLIKFCPTKEEMETLKGYKGETDKLGKCEQFFMELMKVPRTESKLRVFLFKLQFGSQVSDLRKSLNSVNTAVEQVRSSSKFKRIMQTILTLGNALNQGTARGAAVGFRLDSLLKLTDTRARNNKMTLMHYLCKVLAEKLPELLDFHKDLNSLEPASKVQLKYLAEEMQTISKGLEKVVQELSTAENDGPGSEKFIKALKEFLSSAEGEARTLASLYSLVGKNVDALILYFGEDPTRCPYEHVVATLRNFVRTFIQAHEENCKQIEAEKKKAEKEASTSNSNENSKQLETEKKARKEDSKDISKPSSSKQPETEKKAEKEDTKDILKSSDSKQPETEKKAGKEDSRKISKPVTEKKAGKEDSKEKSKPIDLKQPETEKKAGKEDSKEILKPSDSKQPENEKKAGKEDSKEISKLSYAKQPQTEKKAGKGGSKEPSKLSYAKDSETEKKEEKGGLNKISKPSGSKTESDQKNSPIKPIK